MNNRQGKGMEERQWVGGREGVNVSKCRFSSWFAGFLSGSCIGEGKAWATAVVASWLDTADRQAKIWLSSAAD